MTFIQQFAILELNNMWFEPLMELFCKFEKLFGQLPDIAIISLLSEKLFSLKFQTLYVRRLHQRWNSFSSANNISNHTTNTGMYPRWLFQQHIKCKATKLPIIFRGKTLQKTPFLLKTYLTLLHIGSTCIRWSKVMNSRKKAVWYLYFKILTKVQGNMIVKISVVRLVENDKKRYKWKSVRI